MRRHTILWSLLLVALCLGAANAQHAWHEPPGQRVDTYGTTFYVTEPCNVSFHWLHGEGSVILTQDDSRYTTTVYPGTGPITLTGRPNGFGGYQTATYTVHTDAPNTVVEMHIHHAH